MRRTARAAMLAAPLMLGGCDALKLSVMNHAGPVAAEQWHLYLIVGAVLVFVAGPVLILTPIMAWHYRLSNKSDAFKPEWNFSWPLEGFIWIPPIGIVIGLAFVLWHFTHTLDPYRRLGSLEPAVEVQAVALDWKWLFIYPDQHIASINQMVIPLDRPVHVSLTSGTVMQSLLIPQLAGQIYAMAGMTTQLNLAATRPGTFIGENTQFNGPHFQDEKFPVVAVAPAAYDRWIARVQGTAGSFDDAAFKRLFARSIAPKPVFFSHVPDHLFARIQVQSTETRP